MNERDHKAEGSVVMLAAAKEAVAAAKITLLREIEQALPVEANPRNAGRQMGAMITACSLLYGDMLHTFTECGGKGEAVLMAGMFKDLVAEHMVAVANNVDGKFSLKVID